MPEQKDANFTWEDYVTRINNELIGNYGNLLHRVISFAQKNFPDGLHADECTIPSLQKKTGEVYERVAKALEACKFKRALQAIM